MGDAEELINPEDVEFDESGGNSNPKASPEGAKASVAEAAVADSSTVTPSSTVKKIGHGIARNMWQNASNAQT